MNEAIKTQISAFVDGELPDSEADLLLRRMTQDAELRRVAADYLEFGRIMRSESSVRNIERLRERIAAALDDKVVEQDEVGPDLESGKALRPLVGVAMAASVALIAIFGLQMTPGVDTQAPATDTVAGTAEDSSYSTPKPLDQQILQYVERHGAVSSELGDNGMRARLTTLRRSEEVLVEDVADDAAEADSEETPVNDSPTRP
jgi:negative regulator of sigma E activity